MCPSGVGITGLSLWTNQVVIHSANYHQVSALFINLAEERLYTGLSYADQRCSPDIQTCVINPAQRTEQVRSLLKGGRSKNSQGKPVGDAACLGGVATCRCKSWKISAPADRPS